LRFLWGEGGFNASLLPVVLLFAPLWCKPVEVRSLPVIIVVELLFLPVDLVAVVFSLALSGL
jgi:hypothetical protein